MSEEKRRAPRKRADGPLPAYDSIASETIGQVGNLSRTGLMLISRHQPCSEGIYQLRLQLRQPDGSRRPIDVGVQEQWHEPAEAPDQYWAGFRIIAIDDADGAALEAWPQPVNMA